MSILRLLNAGGAFCAFPLGGGLFFYGTIFAVRTLPALHS